MRIPFLNNIISSKKGRFIMKLRKIITMGLAAVMAVSAMSISAFAAKSADDTMPISITSNDPDRVVNTPISDATTQAFFSTTKKYAKIYVNNTSSNTGIVKLMPVVNGVAQENDEIEVMRVNANQDNQIKHINLSAEFPGATSFKVVVTGDDGFSLEGVLAVRVGNSMIMSLPEVTE